MHEYEFRLVVHHPTQPFTSVLNKIETNRPCCHRQQTKVIYAKPHFRYKDGKWETKHVLSKLAIYYDDVWFRWVHSKETSYDNWCYSTHSKFIIAIGNFQDPFQYQQRDSIQLDSQACVYTFKDEQGGYRLVFEWEYLTFDTELCELNNSNAEELLEGLLAYRDVYKLMIDYDSPYYKLDETLIRKPVTCIKERPANMDSYLVAHKIDGVFGIIISSKNCLKEKWEGHERYQKQNTSLGNGFIFSAEKCDSVRVILDVYQVRGCPTASWSKKNILTKFLPTLKDKIPGYEIQQYEQEESNLLPSSLPTDGLVFHNIMNDTVYKLKNIYTLDVVFHKDGWFLLPDNKRFRCKKKLEDGHVYEVSMRNGKVLRKRNDRFTGNTKEQVKKLFECSLWGGPEIKTVTGIPKIKRRKK